MFAESGQDRFEKRQHMQHLSGSDRHIPERLEFLPTASVGDVPHLAAKRVLRGCSAQDRTPSVEVPIRLPVACLQGSWLHSGRPKDYVSGVVQIPVAV
jgi:hypothetical protein